MLLPCGKSRPYLAPDTGVRQICKPLGDLCNRCQVTNELVVDVITGEVIGPLCTAQVVRTEQASQEPMTLEFGKPAEPKRRRRSR